jgi:hypothetical protein
MNCSIPWLSAGIVFLLMAVVPAIACPRLFRDRFREPAPVQFLPPIPPNSDQPPAQPKAADAFEPPAGEVLLFAYRAEGVQIYECQAKKDDPTMFEWALKAPEAILFDDRGEKVGVHLAGPSWEASDGSKIVAAKKASLKAPGGLAVPWLLLQVDSHTGAGAFDRVTFIQRVDTWAGLPPSAGATKENSGKQARVKYQATYRFYAPAVGDTDSAFSIELRQAVNRMGDLAAESKDDELHKQAATFARDHSNDENAFNSVKKGLSLRKRGGLGIGSKAGVYDADGIEHYMMRQTRTPAKLLTVGELKAAGDDLTRAADVLQAIAILTRQYAPKEKKPGKDPLEWTKWADQMKLAAVDLKAAVQADKPEGARQAFLKVRNTCDACHAAFRE